MQTQSNQLAVTRIVRAMLNELGLGLSLHSQPTAQKTLSVKHLNNKWIDVLSSASPDVHDDIVHRLLDVDAADTYRTSMK